MNNRVISSLLLATAIVALPHAPALAAEPAYLIRDNHQDIHLQVNQSTPQVLLRDDGTKNADYVSLHRCSGTVAVAVGDKARVPGHHIGGQDLGAQVWNLPEVQKPGIPWVGFSTVGITSADVSGNETIPVTMVLADAPADGRLVLWQQADLGVDATTLLDSADPSLEWDFYVNSHVHTGMAFTTPGRYEATFTYHPSFSASITAPSTPMSYSLQFLVGDDAIATYGQGLVEQGTIGEDATQCAGAIQTPDSSSPARTGDGTAMPRAIQQGLKGVEGALNKLNKVVDDGQRQDSRRQDSRRQNSQRKDATRTSNIPSVPGSLATETSAGTSAPAFLGAPRSGGATAAHSPVATTAPQASQAQGTVPNAPAATPTATPQRVENPPVQYAAKETYFGAAQGLALGIGLMGILGGLGALYVARKIS